MRNGIQEKGQMRGYKIYGKNWAVNQRNTRKNKKIARARQLLRTNEGVRHKSITEAQVSRK